jgi:hypothetical protein
MEITIEDYGHPASHPPEMITQDANNRFVTDVQIASWDAKATTQEAIDAVQPLADQVATDAAQVAADKIDVAADAADTENNKNLAQTSANNAATSVQQTIINAGNSAQSAVDAETAQVAAETAEANAVTGIVTPVSKTTIELSDIADAINTTNKGPGRMVYNSDTQLMVYAVGGIAGDIWKTFDGVLAHTPI